MPPMLARLRRILSRARFCRPPCGDLVIFDQEGADSLREVVLDGRPSVVLPVRGEVYFLSAALAWRMWRNRHSYPRDLLYLASCLDLMAPRLVMTYIDNSNRFHQLSRLYGKAPFFAVQNGSRDPDCASHFVYSMSDYYCFGQWDSDLFSRHDILRFHHIGSIRLSLYRSTQVPAGTAPAPRFDLCLISNFRPDLIEGDDADWLDDPLLPRRRSLRVMHAHLARYVREGGKRICVATAFAGKGMAQAETAFFQELFGPQVEIIANNKARFSTFRAVEDSRLVVCFNSTAGFESLALDRKVLFCNFTGEPGLDPPRPGPWTLTDDGYEAFAAQADALLSMGDEDYLAQSRPFAAYLFGDYGRFDGLFRLRDAIEAAMTNPGSEGRRCA